MDLTLNRGPGARTDHLRFVRRDARSRFGTLAYARRPCAAVVVRARGGNFCSGGGVHDIIGPLLREAPAFDLVHAHDR